MSQIEQVLGEESRQSLQLEWQVPNPKLLLPESTKVGLRNYLTYIFVAISL